MKWTLARDETSKKAPPDIRRGFFGNEIGYLVTNLNGLGQLDVDTAAVLIEVDVAINTCVDGVIFTHVDIVAWVPFGAALTDDDVA